MSKISAYTAITSVQSDDLLPVVDVHDATMAATGTTKKMTLSQLLDTTAADIQPGGVQAAGAKGLAADAKHVHPLMPWQFLPEAYGAKGDGKVIADAVLNSTTTLTSATANFTSADTGKKIMINGAIGATNIPLITTITYVNATTVTLGSTASVTGSAFQAVYGTDDTAAINSAVSAAKTYALANSYFAEVIFGARIYVLSSGPTQATSPQTNAQIVIPWPAVNGSTQKLVIALTGAGDSGFYQYWASITPNVAGTALVSMTTAPTTVSPTYGQQSVIGGPSAGGAFTGGFANTKAVIRGIEVVCSAYTNQYAFDLGYVSAMRIQQSSAHIFAPAGVGGGNGPLLKDLVSQVAFQNTIGTGLRTPSGANNADSVADDCTFEGYARGMYAYDHFTAGRIGTIYNDVALIIDPTVSAGNQHGVFIAKLSAEVYNGGILVSGGGGAGNNMPVYIRLDAEVTGPAYDISDSGGYLRGEVRWSDPADIRAPIVTGAASLKVVNDRLGPGQWTGAMTPAVPAVPLSGTAQVNTSYRDATVQVVGGTVSQIAIAGVNTGLTSGMFRVPSGKTIAVTYTVAPTWVWWLD